MDKNMEETKNEIVALSTNLGEVALDSIISDGIFRDIPLISTCISIGKVAYSFSNYRVIKNIIKFINELDIKTEEEVDKFKEEYFKDKDYPKIGEKVYYVLDKADDEKKIKWLAECFRLFLDKNINLTQFMRLTSIINNAFVSDAEQILIFDTHKSLTSNNDFIESYVLDHLYSVGLLENQGFNGGDFSGSNSGTIYGLNLFGEIFINIIRPTIAIAYH